MGSVLDLVTQLGDPLALRNRYFVGTVLSSNIRGATAINADPTAYTATEAMMTIFNSASTTTEKGFYIIPDYIQLECTVAAASATDFRIVAYLDDTNRYSSGGTVLTHTVTTPHLAVTDNTPKCTAYIGDVTAAAVSDEVFVFERQLHHVASATANETGDVYNIRFANGAESGGSYDASVESERTVVVPPVYIPPGYTLVLHPIATSAASTAAEFKVEFGYYQSGFGHNV
jgi:hypothetical protein